MFDYGMRLCCDEKNRPYSQDNFLCKKVIGEFVCDGIVKFDSSFFDEQEERDTDEIAELLRDSCLTYSELCNYVGCKTFYAWHISELVVYDKPKELRDFARVSSPYDQTGVKRRAIKSMQGFVYVEEINHG